MSKEETVTVKIPKALVDDIPKREWFKLYHDLEDFVVDAVRHRKEAWMRAYAR